MFTAAALSALVWRGDAASTSATTRKCEYVASDGSHYDLSPLFIAAPRYAPTSAFFVDVRSDAETLTKKPFFLSHSVKSAVASGSAGAGASDGGGGLAASNSSSGTGADATKLSSAPASGVDASIVALPYWSAFFGNAGTLALNPCGGIQNLHNDCPVDARGDPTNSFVQLRSSVAPGLSPLDHRAAHCVGWGTSASMQFADADDTHAGFKIQISQGTDGRSATLHFVCGRSLGEITAFAPSGDGPGASATLTFVTKYACPKSSDADAELERQRRKEADRKARQKLQQNYASLKQARLSPQQAEAPTPAAAAAAALAAASKRFAASPGAPNKGFAKMRELGLHSPGGRSIDALMEAERRKREHQQFADSFDADEPIDEAPQRPPQIVVEQYVAPPPPSPVQQQEQQQQQQQQQQPAVQAKVFARREGRPDSQAKDSVSLDVYQQLLAKMREKAAKQGVSAEEAAHKSAQAQARVESDPLRLQLRRRDDAEQEVEDDRDVESEAPDPMRALDEDVDDDVDTDQLEKIHAKMRQKADVLRQGAQTLASAKDLRRSIGDIDQAAPRKRDAPPEKSVLTSLLASPEFGNQLLLVLLLLVASALGIAWYRVKQQEHAAMKAAAAQELLGGGGGGGKVFAADSPGSHKTSGRVYEYDATSDFEARSTKYTYERFVAELASKSNAPVTEADELDADDVLGSLLPPAPSASSGAGSSGSSGSSLDAFSNGLSRRARSPDTETTNKSD